MRVISWNCNKAKASRHTWDYLLELQPDIALLQEVASLPSSISKMYHVHTHAPRRQNGADQAFMTAILAKFHIKAVFQLTSRLDWVKRELGWFSGNFESCILDLGERTRMTVVSVYSPAWPVAKTRLHGDDPGDVKLTQNKDIGLLTCCGPPCGKCYLKERSHGLSRETSIAPKRSMNGRTDPRGNKEYLDRMKGIGLTECLRHHKGELVPTFLNTDRKTHMHQMDHMFVTGDLSSILSDCYVGDKETVFGQKLSDHLPIIADFASMGEE